jgi:glycosyltransferase involved in cell wall biosynthesis
LWDGGLGGVQRIVRDVFLRPDMPGRHAVLICCGFGCMVDDGADRLALNMRAGWDVARFRRAFGFLAEFDDPLLVIHHTQALLVWALLARRFPCIFVEHGGVLRDVRVPWAKQWLIRRAAPNLRRVVGVSSHVCDRFGERYPDYASRLISLPNPLLIDPAPPRAAPQTPLRLGFIGRLAPEKGAADAIACAQLIAAERPCSLVLVGDGPLRRELVAAASHAELDITFTGMVDDVRPQLAEMDLLLAPSRFEAFNLAAVEANAMGVPVVAYPIGGIAEAIVDGQTGVLTATSTPAAMATAALALAGDSTRYAAMSEAGCTHACKTFGRTRYIRQWSELLAAVD